MTETILRKITEAFGRSCPFEVRRLHSGSHPLPDKPCIYAGIESIKADTVFSDEKMYRFAVSAVVDMRVTAPLKYGAESVIRIAEDYVIPAAEKAGLCLCGFSYGAAKDRISEKTHAAEMKFSLAGIYTSIYGGDEA